ELECTAALTHLLGDFALSHDRSFHGVLAGEISELVLAPLALKILLHLNRGRLSYVHDRDPIEDASEAHERSSSTSLWTMDGAASSRSLASTATTTWRVFSSTRWRMHA